MYVILYNPGSGGNLVASVIDPKNYFFAATPNNQNLLHMGIDKNSLRYEYSVVGFDPKYKNVTERRQEKLNLLTKIKNEYTAISDHDVPMFVDFVNFQLRYKEFDYIIIDDTSSIESTTKRNLEVQLLETSGVVVDPNNKKWISQLKHFNVCDKFIGFDDIINGNLIKILKQWVNTPLNENIYEIWLEKNRKYFFDT